MLLASSFEKNLLRISHLDQKKSQVKSRDLIFHQLQTMESLKDYGCQQELKSPLLHRGDNFAWSSSSERDLSTITDEGQKKTQDHDDLALSSSIQRVSSKISDGSHKESQEQRQKLGVKQLQIPGSWDESESHPQQGDFLLQIQEDLDEEPVLRVY